MTTQENPMSADEALSPDQFETLYHLTDKANFKPNAKKVPHDNTLAIQHRERPGLYLTAHPEGWVNGHGYARPFVAEVKVPKGLAEQGRWGGERFVPGEHLNQAEVSRVIPLDAHARETYGSPGWIEEHHGTTFDTHEPIARPGFNAPMAAHYPYKGYKYDGPDAREMDADTVKEHRSRARAFQKARERDY